MPNAKNRIKLTGDTHLPDVGSDDDDREESRPEAAGAEDGSERKTRDATMGKGEGKPRDGGERR